MEFISTKKKFTDAQKCAAKAFRIGDTQEILQTGNNIDTVKKSGAWAGVGFRSYVELEIDASPKARELPISLIDGSSSDDEPPAKKNRSTRKN